MRSVTVGLRREEHERGGEKPVRHLQRLRDRSTEERRAAAGDAQTGETGSARADVCAGAHRDERPSGCYEERRRPFPPCKCGRCLIGVVHERDDSERDQDGEQQHRGAPMEHHRERTICKKDRRAAEQDLQHEHGGERSQHPA
jgi:hypothetical protein